MNGIGIGCLLVVEFCVQNLDRELMVMNNRDASSLDDSCKMGKI